MTVVNIFVGDKKLNKFIDGLDMNDSGLKLFGILIDMVTAINQSTAMAIQYTSNHYEERIKALEHYNESHDLDELMSRIARCEDILKKLEEAMAEFGIDITAKLQEVIKPLENRIAKLEERLRLKVLKSQQAMVDYVLGKTKEAEADKQEKCLSTCKRCKRDFIYNMGHGVEYCPDCSGLL